LGPFSFGMRCADTALDSATPPSWLYPVGVPDGNIDLNGKTFTFHDRQSSQGAA